MAVATASMVPPVDPTSPHSTQNQMTYPTNSNASSSYQAQIPQLQLPMQQGATVNTPMFSQQEVLRFIQAAVLTTQRSQSTAASSSQTTSILPEERIMKPRVHMYASRYPASTSSSPSSEKHQNGNGDSNSDSDAPGGTMITTLELPGLRKSDIAITARPNGELIVSGERRPQHLSYIAGLMDVEQESVKDNGRTVFNELKFGRFQRVFKLPEGIDPSMISASMEDGMLIVSWPIPASIFNQQDNPSQTQSQSQAHMSSSTSTTGAAHAESSIAMQAEQTVSG